MPPRGRHSRGPAPIEVPAQEDERSTMEKWLLPFAFGFFCGCVFIAAGMMMFWV